MRPEAEPTTRKDPGYYQGANTHVLELLPDQATRILDVGCAAGGLGRLIKERRPEARVEGLDREASALADAAEYLDHVERVDLDGPLPALSQTYDAILCGDVLEHLIDPWRVLRWLTQHLVEGGHVVASIPNLRYYKVVRDLVFRGRFTYRDSGILDATHLRFFTLREMKALFERAGLHVEQVKPRLGGGNVLMQGLDVLALGRLQGLRAKQYTLLGRKTS